MKDNYQQYTLSLYQVRGKLLQPIQEIRFPQPKNFNSMGIFLEELRKVVAFHCNIPQNSKYNLIKGKSHLTFNLYDPDGSLAASVTYSPIVIHPYIQLMDFDKQFKYLTDQEFEELKSLLGKVRWQDDACPEDEFRYSRLLHYCSDEQAVQCMNYEMEMINKFRYNDTHCVQ